MLVTDISIASDLENGIGLSIVGGARSYNMPPTFESGGGGPYSMVCPPHF